jgi:outer membrane protein
MAQAADTLEKSSTVKSIWNSFIVVLVLASAMSSPAWAEEFKISVVDRAKVIKESQAGKRGTATLQEYMKVRQKVVETDQADLVKFSEDYSKQAAVLSPEARKDKEETFNKKRAEYQRKAEELEREVQTKQRELAGIFSKQIDDVVKAIAEKEQFLLVLDNSEGAGTYYANSAIDITDRVIKEMDKVNK